MSTKHRRHALARFNDFDRQITDADLDVPRLAQLLQPYGPKQRSLERLKAGLSIRKTGAYRAGHAINRSLKKMGKDQIDLNQFIETLD